MEAAKSRHPAVRLAAATAAGRCLTGELLGGLFLRDLAQIASTGAQHLRTRPKSVTGNLSSAITAAVVLGDGDQHMRHGTL